MKNTSFTTKIRTTTVWLLFLYLLIANSCGAICPTTTLQERASLIAHSDFGFTQEQATAICQFIDQEQVSHPEWDYTIFMPQETHLPCIIERNSTLKKFLIRMITGGYIAAGGFKVVNKTIMYGSHPRVVAECTTGDSAKRELQILEQLRGCKGIVPFLGASERSGRYSIFLKYYPIGSLGIILCTQKKLSIPQTAKIGQDIAQGLQSMHKKGLSHGDLHWGNVLLQPKKNGLYRAVLIDFGKSLNPYEVNEELPQGIVTRNPLEVLETPFQHVDRFSIDVYALGSILYRCLWGEGQPWLFEFNPRSINTYGKAEIEHIRQRIIKSYNQTRALRMGKEYVSGKKKAASPQETLKELIFDMLHYNPKSRPNIQAVVQRLNKIAVQLEI
jgi:serine/threonine protein kinase